MVRTRFRWGFTLVELLVVLVILSLLGGLVGPRVMRHLGDAKTKTARLQIEDLGAALDIYRLDIGSYPDTDQGLSALIKAPEGAEGWQGPYLKKTRVPIDPWGNPYRYRAPGEFGEYELISYGADNAEGGEKENADIVSWE